MSTPGALTSDATSHDPFDLQGQAQASRETADDRRLQRLQEVDDFQWLMSDKRGRRVMWRLMGATGVFRSSFNESGTAMAFAEGRRDIGLQLLAQATRDPDAYALMQREHQVKPE